MTASSSDLLALLLTLAACHAGLPPEPPGADPSDPHAAIPAYQAPANLYETSAFRDTNPAATPHAGHAHHDHAAPSTPRNPPPNPHHDHAASSTPHNPPPNPAHPTEPPP